MESAPDTTPADELIKEVRKAMQSTGDRAQEFLEIFCKAFQLKYKRLTDEERTTLKRLFKRSPLIKNSGINFRRRPWKLKQPLQDRLLQRLFMLFRKQ